MSKRKTSFAEEAAARSGDATRTGCGINLAGTRFLTERLMLRPLEASDAAAMAELAGAVDVASMAGYVPYPLTLEAALDWISDIAPDGGRQCALAINATAAGLPARFVGVCGFASEGLDTASIGYFIGKPYWGRGYATEATRTLIGHIREASPRMTLTATHFLGNDASARVLAKLGFVLVGAGHGWCPVRRLNLPTLRYTLPATSLRKAAAP